MNALTGFLADATTAPPATGTTPTGTQGPPPSGVQSLFGSPLTLIVLMVIMMYFLIFRPQSQRAKQQKILLEALKSGDRVATASGIIGIVVSVKDKTVTLRSADAKMEVTKTSVTEILERGGDSSAS